MDPSLRVLMFLSAHWSPEVLISIFQEAELEGETGANGRMKMVCVFAVEMKSKRDVKSISISDESRDRVLFEGNLGRLLEVSIIAGSALELVGTNGVLRVDVDEEVLQQVLISPGRELSLSSEVGSSTSTNRKGEKKDVLGR